MKDYTSAHAMKQKQEAKQLVKLRAEHKRHAMVQMARDSEKKRIKAERAARELAGADELVRVMTAVEQEAKMVSLLTAEVSTSTARCAFETHVTTLDHASTLGGHCACGGVGRGGHATEPGAGGESGARSIAADD